MTVFPLCRAIAAVTLTPLCFSHSVSCSDHHPRTAKVSPLTMTDEQLMHVLVKDVGNSQIFRKSSGEFKKLKKWKGVILNAQKRVTEICWERDYDDVDLGGGSMSLEWLPLQVVNIRVRNQMLSGTFDMRVLPPALKTLFLSYNDFEGTIDMHSVPPDLEFMYLSYNKITGPLDLRYIPASLQKIGLACNEIEQEELVIGEMPKNLKWISLSFNKIGKIVDLSGQPIEDDRIEFNQA